jgi:hypothetical protein
MDPLDHETTFEQAWADPANTRVRRFLNPELRGGAAHPRPPVFRMTLNATSSVISMMSTSPRRFVQGIGASNSWPLQTEVDRLTTELEGHLDYEEEKLIPVLDAAT